MDAAHFLVAAKQEHSLVTAVQWMLAEQPPTSTVSEVEYVRGQRALAGATEVSRFVPKRV